MRDLDTARKSHPQSSAFLSPLAGILALLLCCAAFPGGLPAAETTPEIPPEGKVATVGERSITVEQLQGELAGQRGGEDQRRAVLDRLVRRELTHQAALAEGYDKNPEILAGLRRLLVNMYRRDHLEPLLAELKVSDEEIAAYYEEHVADFTLPARVRAAVIRVSVPGKASDEKKAELRKRIDQARAEALELPAATLTFGSVAVRYSDDQASRYRGGDTGWLQLGKEEYRWPKEVSSVIFSLTDPGETSQVVEAPDGFYLVKLVESEASVPRPQEEVRDWVAHAILREKRTETEQRFFEELAGRIPVSIDEELLKSLPAMEETEPPAPPPLPGQ